MNPALVTDQYIVETLWRRWNIVPKKFGKEWHAPCPMCGGKDRAWVEPDGYFHCRYNDFGEWLDSDRPYVGTPENAAKFLAEMERKRIEREQDIANRLAQLRTHDPRAAYQQGRDDEAAFLTKQYFNSQGISDFLIKRYSLGYVRDLMVMTDSGLAQMEAYSIPITDPVTDELVNIQYRLKDPPPNIQKYRQMHGLPAASFFAEGHPDGLHGQAIVTEGSKKAIVTYDRIDGACQVVGLPGCSPSEKLLAQLKPFDKIWLCLDPGCKTQEERIKKMLPQTKIVNLTDKIDDMWLGGMTLDEFRGYIRLAK